MKRTFSSILLFFALFFSLKLSATVYYVNAGYTGSVSDGTSWVTPYIVLDSAIKYAIDGDEIWMAKGNYVAPKTPRTTGYLITKSIVIYGGFAGTETSIYARDLVNNQSTISGNNVLIFNLIQNKLFTIDGLILVNFGDAIESLEDSVTSSFNLVQGDRYKLTINNCNISNCNGEAINLAYYADLSISNSTFSATGSIDIDQILSFSDVSTIKLENSIFSETGINVVSATTFSALNCVFNKLNFPIDIDNQLSGTGSFQGCSFSNLIEPVLSLNNSTNTNVEIDSCVFSGWQNTSLFYNSNLALNISNSIFQNGVSSGPIITSNNLSLNNVSFTNIYLNEPGINSVGVIQMNKVTVDTISGSSNGQFINCEGQLTIENSVFKNNSVQLIFNYSSTSSTAIANSIFENNTIPSTSSFNDLFHLSGSTNINNTQLLNNTSNNLNPSNGLITFNSPSNSLVKNSIFKGNSTANLSGAICNFDNLVIDSCVFDSNSNELFSAPFLSAAAIYSSTNYSVQTITNSNFINNKGYTTGAVLTSGTNLEVQNCNFNNNLSTNNSYSASEYQAYSNAGALNINLQTTSSTETGVISNCSFIGNQANAGPGAIKNSSGAIGISIQDCIFRNNSSVQDAAAILNYQSNLQIINSLFDSNTSSATPSNSFYGNSTGMVGTIFNYELQPFDNTSLEIYNSTFVKNTTASGASVLAGLAPKYLVNSILWNNGTNLPMIVTSKNSVGFNEVTSSVLNCDIQGGYSGTVIYNVDPKFVDFVGGNYRLSCQSPLINKGNNTYAFSFPDLDGTARIFADTIDMGAYETHVDPSASNKSIVTAFTVPATACKAQVITVINSTVNPANYTYYWNFGNGITSTLINPTISYASAGTYTITLIASDYCGESNSVSQQITIEDISAVSITNPSAVCPATQQTYNTNAVCQSLVWTVTGGTIQSGQGTTSISVLWGDGSGGNGTVTLLATGCGTGACEVPISISIPIVPLNNVIVGNTKSCQSSLVQYGTQVKDVTPSTVYTWSVKGGNIYSSASGYNLTGIQVQWSSIDTLGVIYLTTHNELLQCGATDSFKVKIRPSYKLTGPTVACVSQSSNYAVSVNVGNMIWQVTGGSNTISSGNAAWGNIPGLYNVIAKPQDSTMSCTNSDTVTINVYAAPVITSITGQTSLNINDVDLYTAITSEDPSNLTFNWTTAGGSILSTYSNTATISRNGFLPDNILLTVVS